MTETQLNQDTQQPAQEEKTFHFEKFKFKMELVKWFIGSVALVIMTVIIDKGFKERSAGIQEMQAYDKYVDIILEADNIEERWKLSEYFSIVTPTDRLRERWIAYKGLIEEDYRKFKELKEKEFELQQRQNFQVTEDSITKVDLKLNEIQNQLAPFEKKLISTGSLNSAQEWEEKGFEHLLNRDVENAILAFQNSENSQNGYHQVYEIAGFLRENKTSLTDPNSPNWTNVNARIARDYSWKMPVSVKKELLKYAD